MKARSICVVITARPSYSRIRSALHHIQRDPGLELLLVVAASALLPRFGSTVDLIERDGFEVARRVYTVLEGGSPTIMAKTAGIGLMELATAFESLQPDVVVTIADRYETLSTATAAAYMNIPLVHVQGGEVTGSIDEKVRHAVTKLADLHLVATARAAERVRRMGEDPARVFVTGCPSIDIAAEIQQSPQLDFDPYERYGGVGMFPELSDEYVVVLQHPVTTEYEAARHHITETLEAVRGLGVSALWFWPNVDAGSDATSNGIRRFREEHNPRNIHFIKNMTPSDFLRVVFNSRCIVGNSSVAIRECSFLGVPAVNIGSRQQGRERGRNVVDVSYDREEIRQGLDAQLHSAKRTPDSLYGDGQAGKRIAQRLLTAPLDIEKRLTY